MAADVQKLIEGGGGGAEAPAASQQASSAVRSWLLFNTIVSKDADMPKHKGEKGLVAYLCFLQGFFRRVQKNFSFDPTSASKASRSLSFDTIVL